VGSEFLRQLVAKDFRKADHIVEEFGIEQLTAGKSPLEHGGSQHGSPRIKRGRHSGWAGADYDNVVLTRFSQSTHL
jgi:hypothetical protein